MKQRIVFIGIVLFLISVVVIVFSVVQAPFPVKKAYYDPQTSNLIKESFVVPAISYAHKFSNLQSGELIHIFFICTDGGNRDVDFYLMDELN